ncbi:hypothetical protein P22_1019 [Propionispora sp. 2/2-37]|nr:hypothetical protein P22_1019 [Propionispora sp. 2/2-37]
MDEQVFAKLEQVCFGVVVARGINNTRRSPEIDRLLLQSIQMVQNRFQNEKVKTAAEILPYRQAFSLLRINPNKYMSSIEAMASRLEKKKEFPHINPVVDLGNAISLKYLVPIGAHDLSSTQGDIQVRFSRNGDIFIPFGAAEQEVLDAGELIYSAGNLVKTRRWIWRQSEQGKITADSSKVFFPIDGFIAENDDRVLQARDELAKLLARLFSCEVQVGWVDKKNPVMDL